MRVPTATSAFAPGGAPTETVADSARVQGGARRVGPVANQPETIMTTRLIRNAVSLSALLALFSIQVRAAEPAAATPAA